MPDPWHGINDPGYWIKPQAAPADNTRVAVTDNDIKAKEKPDPIATLSDAKFVSPQAGVKFNDKCPVQVSVAYKTQTLQTRVTFKLFCNYKGKREDLKTKIDANESNGIAKAELQLFYPDDYSDGSVEYFFTAEHCRGDKVIESDKMTLPTMKSGNLKKGNYDDCAVEQYASRKKDGEGYVEDRKVEQLQKELISLGFTDLGKADGDFGQKTENSLKDFQKEASSGTRQKKDNSEITIQDPLQNPVQGEADEATLKEINRWKKEDWHKRTKANRGGFADFAKAVGQRESSDNYKAENQYGYLGRYQFGMARIMDLSNMVERIDPKSTGFGNSLFQWKEGFSKEKFLSDSDLQDKMFRKHAMQYANNFKGKYAGSFGKEVKLDDPYFSKSAKTTISQVEISLSGLVGGAHIAGPGSVKDFVDDNDDKKDGNGTPISEYIYLFANYDLDSD